MCALISTCIEDIASKDGSHPLLLVMSSSSPWPSLCQHVWVCLYMCPSAFLCRGLQTIGQAYEDMQSQNRRLLQQLSERDEYSTQVSHPTFRTRECPCETQARHPTLRTLECPCGGD